MRARIVGPDGPLQGAVRVPGDKSISHRAVLFAAMAQGSSRLTGVLDSADVRATIAAVISLGADLDIESGADGSLDVVADGWGMEGARAGGGPIECGNSGTTARLLMGLLAGAAGTFELRGDESLSARPMTRVADPLRLMGSEIMTAPGGTLPVHVNGRELRAIRYELPVASAQVKSAVLLAGLAAEGRTIVIEPAPTRDHTERLLPAFGVGVGRSREEMSCWVDGPATPIASDVDVPGDPSSAAFVVAAALLVPESSVSVPAVALNPTRAGFLRVLDRMGAAICVEPTGASGAEPVGTVTTRWGEALQGTDVAPEEVPSLIDEVPVLAVVATQARGVTRFEGVGELRVKESDRLEALEHGLATLGATVRAGEDWLEVEGPCALRGCDLDSLGDHRLAMAWAVAGLAASSPVHVEGFEAVEVSYPRFADDLAALAGASVVLSS